MRKAHVDPFLISSAALSAPSPSKYVDELRDKPFLAYTKILLLELNIEQCYV